MGYRSRNTWAARLRRTIAAFLPGSRDRKGQCRRCGSCCKLPNVCWFLRYDQEGLAYCAIYPFRPLNCRKYPRTRSEFITEQTCGYWFDGHQARQWGSDKAKKVCNDQPVKIQ
ncbi:MAG: hypothetical protein QHH07_03190 [Sedimentisphaerales bacterium]|nr:hypothetical protein [Sedimentisphaerales bacterium]